jgi:rhomboid family GlyGly-CTERM serine protease
VNKGLSVSSFRVAKWRLRRWWPVVALGLASLALAFGGDEARTFARYDSVMIAGGEYWRLITGHLVHLGWGHLWPNLVALLLIGALFEDLFDATDWLVLAATAAGAIDLGFAVLDPRVDWYVGLSGVLHGLVAAGALTAALQRQAIAIWLGIGLGGKLLWEQLVGPVPFTAAAVGGPVVVEAHLYGAAGGLLGAAAIRVVRARRSRV